MLEDWRIWSLMATAGTHKHTSKTQRQAGKQHCFPSGLCIHGPPIRRFPRWQVTNTLDNSQISIKFATIILPSSPHWILTTIALWFVPHTCSYCCNPHSLQHSEFSSPNEIFLHLNEGTWFCTFVVSASIPSAYLAQTRHIYTIEWTSSLLEKLWGQELPRGRMLSLRAKDGNGNDLRLRQRKAYFWECGLQLVLPSSSFTNLNLSFYRSLAKGK